MSLSELMHVSERARRIEVFTGKGRRQRLEFAVAPASALPHLPGEISERRAFADQLDAKQKADQPQGLTGRFAHRISESRIPRSPLASTHPQLGKGRIVRAKTTFEMPSIMKKTMRSSVTVSSACAGRAGTGSRPVGPRRPR